MPHINTGGRATGFLLAIVLVTGLGHPPGTAAAEAANQAITKKSSLGLS